MGFPLAWQKLEKQKSEGGLGFKAFKSMNQALLDKWLWRIGERGDSLWKQVLVAKYKVLRDGWEIQNPNYQSSNLWKGIVST